MVFVTVQWLGHSFEWAAKYEAKGENEHVFSHGHHWKSWRRHRAASAEAGETGASTGAQSRGSGEVGRARCGVGGWRLERCDIHRGSARRRQGRVRYVAGCMGALARF